MRRRAPLPLAPLLLAPLLLASLLVACRPPDAGGRRASGAGSADGREVAVEVLAAPRVGPARVRVSVRRDDAPVDGARVEVTGDMTHAGMQPVIATAVPQGGGTYLTDGFEFTMAGDWVLIADVTYPDGVEAEGTAFVTVTGR